MTDITLSDSSFLDLFEPIQPPAITNESYDPDLTGGNLEIKYIMNCRQSEEISKTKTFTWSHAKSKKSDYTVNAFIRPSIIAIKGIPFRFMSGLRYTDFEEKDITKRNICRTYKAVETLPDGTTFVKKSSLPLSYPITNINRSNAEPTIPHWTLTDHPNIELYGTRKDPETNESLKCLDCINKGLHMITGEKDGKPAILNSCKPVATIIFLVTHLGFINADSLLEGQQNYKLDWVELKEGCSSLYPDRIITQVLRENEKPENYNLENPFILKIPLTKAQTNIKLGSGEYSFEPVPQNFYPNHVVGMHDLIKNLQSPQNLNVSCFLERSTRHYVYTTAYELYIAELPSKKHNQEVIFIGAETDHGGMFANMSNGEIAKTLLEIEREELSSGHIPLANNTATATTTTTVKPVVSTEEEVSSVKKAFALPEALQKKTLGR